MGQRISRPCAGAKGRRTGAVVRGARVVCVIASLAFLGLAQSIPAQEPASTQPVHPEFKRLLDASLLASGVALLVVGNPIDVTRKPVPPEGLDPGDIHWSLDRGIIGKRSTRADSESDYFRDAAVAYPMVLRLISQPPGTRLSGTLWRSMEYIEAILIAEGVSAVIKNSADRPRPYTYLPADQRPNNRAYDVRVDEAFRSMPSGHATISFCAAAFAMTDQLISRPNASWQERAGVSFLGGFLAGMTAGMRVEGGQHFPSDTMVGGLIGIASGVTVPMVHEYIGADGHRAGRPSARAWWQAVAGLGAGTGIGFLAAHLY
jgi:hypothetical protein